MIVASIMKFWLLTVVGTFGRVVVFPTSEERGKITPVFKSGNPTLLYNYRPIIVIPALSKVLYISYLNLSYLNLLRRVALRQKPFFKRPSDKNLITIY